jgi:alkylresorcinol/alkylpyrone synthase
LVYVGLSRAADYTLAYPDHTAALLCVEICSLTMQRDDMSTKNLIAAGLFGDGAAAVVVRGSKTANSPSTGSRIPIREGPQILGCGSVFYPDTEEIMGWDISENDFKVGIDARRRQMPWPKTES